MAKKQEKANEQGTQTRKALRAEQLQSSTAARWYGDDDIARRAYQRFLERGGQHGHDIDDWFEAERELRSQGAGGPVGGAQANGPSRAKKGPTPQRPDRAADQH